MNITHPLSDKYKAVWTMRNEDFFVLRWAQPDFIREFIRLNSQPYVGGCIIGSECYIPAKDYLSKPGVADGKYAFERQWLFYKVWGNLLYDPATPDSYFSRALAARFAGADGAELLTAWKLASANANRFASFFQGTWDATIYTEAFATMVSGKGTQLIDINRFIEQPTLDASYMGIREFVNLTAPATNRFDPLALAKLAETESDEALRIVARQKVRSPSQPLLVELTDIEAWSWHGKYFAAKLRGGVALARFRKTGDGAQQQFAIAQLTEALSCWKELVRCVETYNVTVMPYQFDKAFSWRKHTPIAEHDIEIAQSPQK